jgi:hypothetical protein
MADETRRPRADTADDPRADARDNIEENAAQRQSDASPDVVAEGERQVVESSDRVDGRGSSANGTPAFDEADGETRRKLYKEGAKIVSRID